MNTCIECHEPTPRSISTNCARRHVRDSPHVLVGATRTVGKPFDLYRAAGRRGRRDLFGFLISTIRLPRRWRPSTSARCSSCDVAQPYGFAAGLLMADCIHRRQSSIVSTRSTANVAIAASCSGNRCRFPI